MEGFRRSGIQALPFLKGSQDAIFDGKSAEIIAQDGDVAPRSLFFDVGYNLRLVYPRRGKRGFLFGQTIKIGRRHAKQIAHP